MHLSVAKCSTTSNELRRRLRSSNKGLAAFGWVPVEGGRVWGVGPWTIVGSLTTARFRIYLVKTLS